MTKEDKKGVKIDAVDQNESDRKVHSAGSTKDWSESDYNIVVESGMQEPRRGKD